MKHKRLLIFLVLVTFALVGGIWFLMSRPQVPVYEFTVARTSDLVQEVNVTGKVVPTQSVDLAFERSGRVSSVPVKVGAHVQDGSLLASQDSAELAAQVMEALAKVDVAKAQLSQYQAALRNQQAKLRELEAGTRPEEIQVKQAELEAARQDLQNDYAGIPSALRTDFTKADDAVRVKAAAAFDSSGTNYHLNYNACSGELETRVIQLRDLSERELLQWQRSLDVLSTEPAALDTALEEAATHVTLCKQFLDALNDSLTTNCTASDTTLNTIRTDVNTARVTVAGLASDVSDLQQAIAAQQRTVAQTERELQLKLAGSTAEVIAAQQALVAQAEANVTAQQAQIRQMEANVSTMKAQLGKAVLRAPFSGTITAATLEPGEMIAAGTNVISIISDAGYEIEAKVSEADIAKVKLGDAAQLTLDAYGSDVVFGAKVSEIDPAETVVDGVPTYKVTLQFIPADPRVKSGMSADLDIRTAERKGVVVIPQRSVVTRDGEKIVRLLKVSSNGPDRLQTQAIDTLVTLGLRGSDGYVEILSGVVAGDKVLSAPAD
ncbi:MAG: efflux RND transporter periplasmic adaptor subunit [Patescibacteria group bacterium]|nr:efflux RND transporter periplasmic adaptor subunit [Patescibacteria group bacterium]